MPSDASESDALECVEDGPDCEGPREWHSTDPGVKPARVRCRGHWYALCDRIQDIERRYPDSPMAPPDFDPTFAGESWDEEW